MASLVSRVTLPITNLTQSNRFWLRSAIAVGLLAFVVAAGYLADLTQLQLLLLLPLAAAGAVILWRWPQAGLVVLTLVGMFTPALGPQDLNLAIVLVPVLWGLWLLKQLVSENEIQFARSRTFLPIVGFMLISGIAFIVGQLPWFTFAANAALDAQVAGFALFLAAAGAFLLAANVIKNLRWLELMVWAFIAVGALYIIGFSFPVIQPVIRLIFRSGSIGGIFWAWLPPLMLSQALINKRLPLALRLLLGALTLLTLYAGYVLNFSWKSGWIPSFAAVGAVLFFYSWRMTISLALLAIVPIMRVFPELLSSDSYSISTRLDAWNIMFEIIRTSPVLGFGFANYYWYTPLFRIRGYEVEFNSHNNLVDVTAQTGLVGLGFLLWFFLEIFRLGLRLRRALPEGFARAYAYGAIGGLAGTIAASMLGDWLLPFVYNVGMGGFRTGILAWLFFGGLVALEQIYVRSPGTGSEGAAQVGQ